MVGKTVSKFWAENLHESFDGTPLVNSSEVFGQNQWIGEHTRFPRGKYYVNCVKAKINALLTGAEFVKGRLKLEKCRGEFVNTETLNHILQFCHRIHSSRLKCHNAITRYIAKNCEKKRLREGKNSSWRHRRQTRFIYREGQQDHRHRRASDGRPARA